MRVKESIRICSKAIKQDMNANEKQFYQHQLSLYKVLILTRKACPKENFAFFL